MELIRYDFEKVPMDYINWFINKWSDSLVHAVGKRRDLPLGKAHTMLPPGLSRADIWDLRTGFKVPFPPDSTIIRRKGMIAVPIGNTIDDHLVPSLEQFLSSRSYAIALFNSAGKPHWQFIRRSRARGIIVQGVRGREFLPYLIWEDTEPARIKRTIRLTRFGTVVVLFELSPKEAPLWQVKRRHCGLSEIEACAFRAHTIIFDAYDFEGYLVWEATDKA